MSLEDLIFFSLWTIGGSNVVTQIKGHICMKPSLALGPRISPDLLDPKIDDRGTCVQRVATLSCNPQVLCVCLTTEAGKWPVFDLAKLCNFLYSRNRTPLLRLQSRNSYGRSKLYRYFRSPVN